MRCERTDWSEWRGFHKQVHRLIRLSTQCGGVCVTMMGRGMRKRVPKAPNPGDRRIRPSSNRAADWRQSHSYYGAVPQACGVM